MLKQSVIIKYFQIDHRIGYFKSYKEYCITLLE